MKLSVREVMTRSVISIHGDSPIDEAISLLLRHNVSGLPVVDEENHLIGVISERDLLGLLYDLETTRDQIIEYATKDVVSVREEESLLSVADHFMARPIRRLPVVDENNKLVGVVSRRDLIRFIREVRLKITGVLESRRVIKPPLQGSSAAVL